VGENNPALREAILEGLDGFGIAIDPALNREAGDAARALHAPDSAVAVLVIPTREELQIAREVRALIGGAA
jgi:acetate kinase